jgi:hypothetical protein
MKNRIDLTIDWKFHYERGIYWERQLRHELQHEQTGDLRRRRGVIGLSLVGMASIRRRLCCRTAFSSTLPTPFGNFDSDRVNSSDTAYRLGAPDGSISLASLAVNIQLPHLAAPIGESGG